MNRRDNRLVWVDVETTGLDPNNDALLEIAWIITDNDLNTIVEKSYVREGAYLDFKDGEETFVTFFGIDKLYMMEHIVQKMHTKNGLLNELKGGRPLFFIESEFRTDIEEHTTLHNAPMAGNSAGFDRAFLKVHMPSIDPIVNFRNVDVSSLNILAKKWYPKALEGFKKGRSHRALDDIKESIAELKHYRCTFLQGQHEPNEETRKALNDVKEGKGLTKIDDIDEFFDEIEDNVNSV